ncbi:MAG: hypothetical protein CMP06_12945 [Xanthomonadales bacterium]|nr:hypothetical protein [Xanthomonadales bacterium]
MLKFTNLLSTRSSFMIFNHVFILMALELSLEGNKVIDFFLKFTCRQATFTHRYLSADNQLLIVHQVALVGLVGDIFQLAIKQPVTIWQVVVCKQVSCRFRKHLDIIDIYRNGDSANLFCSPQ